MTLTRYAPGGAVAAASQLAALAGAAALTRGGNAADAAVAAAAAMAVTGPCRAGSGADAERLRAEGATSMPFQGDVRSVTVPGFVDGLTALHERFGSRPLGELLEPARRLARDGFPVSPTLAAASAGLSAAERSAAFGDPAPLVAGRRLALPGVGEALAAIASRGRDGFYLGPAGEDLLTVGAGEFTAADLARASADWAEPLRLEAFGRDLWTVPPNSQGYLALGGAWIAAQAGLPDDPADELWAFLLVEAARQAAYDRPAVLHEHADGTALIAPERLGPRAAAIRERA